MVAHDQGVADELEHRVVAERQHRAARLVELGQAGRRPLAQRRQRLGQPRRLDQVGRRAIELPLAHQACHAGEPANGAAAGSVVGLPQVFVPAGRGDAGTVAAGAREVAVGPGHPGGVHLGLGQPLEQRRVRLGSDVLAQRGQVPGAGDHGDALVADLLRCAYALAHVGLAQGLAVGGFGGRMLVADLGAQRLHRRGDRVEQLGAVGALFDHVVPPGLAIVVAGGAGQPGQRVAVLQVGVDRAGKARRFVRRPDGLRLSSSIGLARFGSRRRGFFGRALGLARVARGLFHAQLVRQRQVDEAYRHAMRCGPAQRLPFRRERGERVIDGKARLVRAVAQQRHRRGHCLVQHEGQQLVGLGRAFDQHAVGL